MIFNFGNQNSNLANEFKLVKTIKSPSAGFDGTLDVEYTASKKCNIIIFFSTGNSQYTAFTSISNCGTKIMSQVDSLCTVSNALATDAVYMTNSASIDGTTNVQANSGHYAYIFILTDE